MPAARAPDSSTRFPGWDARFEAALDRLSIAATRPARGHLAGYARSTVRGRALEFADHRPYAVGDDPRLVDWRVYARQDRLYLKQFQEERARPLTLLLDASASLDWGAGEAHKGLFARRVAAALAWVALGRLEPVQLCLLDAEPKVLPTAAGRSAAPALFRRLGEAREAGRTPLADSLASVLRRLPPRTGPTFLLSDLLDPSWPEALRALGGCAGGGGVVQVLAPDEWDPALGGEVELEDSETGALLPTRIGPPELAAYHARLEAFLADVRATCRRMGLLHVALDSGAGLREAVLRRLPAAGVLV